MDGFNKVYLYSTMLNTKVKGGFRKPRFFIIFIINYTLLVFFDNVATDFSKRNLLVNVAPQPEFAGFGRGNNRVTGLEKVFCCVLIG
jgi:hypothetical protein